jgi:hypothetical protein
VNTSAKGARNERRVRHLLEADGYPIVHAKGSLGVFDLVGFACSRLRLIQVNSNRNARPAERVALAAFGNAPRFATRKLWIFLDRCSEPRIEVLR